MVSDPKPIRLCFVVESDTDVRLAEGLAERFDFTLLGRPTGGSVKLSQPPSRPVRTVTGPPSRTAFVRFVWDYLRAHRDEFDFVLVQGYGMAALGANLAARSTGIPTAMLVCSPVELYYQCRKASSTGKPFRQAEMLAIRMFARMNARLGGRYVVLSEHLADVVRGHGGKARIDFIPLYGVDTKLFRPADRPKSELKRELGLPEQGAVIFFSSRIAPEKDSETLLAALRSLREKGKDLWLLHRSGGFERFRAEAEHYGVLDRVIATDAVHPYKELHLSYQACDLCVQSSREEGLGFSPLEALACDVPVIASAVGGLRETIIDGQTGWTYPVGDDAALAARIEEVLSDPEEAARRTEAGRQQVIRRFDRDVVFAALERLARDLQKTPR